MATNDGFFGPDVVQKFRILESEKKMKITKIVGHVFSLTTHIFITRRFKKTLFLGERNYLEDITFFSSVCEVIGILVGDGK